jgi:hypothetical protein
VPEDRADGLFLLVEQAHLAADAAMIALFGLRHHVQVCAELLVVLPAGTVDPLQLLVPGVATPIGARQLGQLEGMPQLLGRGQMRAETEVVPIALAIDRDLRVGGQAFDMLGLIFFADRQEVIDRPRAVPNLARDRLVAVDDLVHALLDLLQILGREGLFAREVVVKAVLDRRAERHLETGVELLRRLGQNMRAVVAQQLQGVVVPLGYDLDRRIPVDLPGQVPQLAVHFDRHSRLGEPGSDVRGHIGARRRAVVTAFGAIGQRDRNHE